MNNGKVRVYELSKDLNLDNRDILALCDQLNILVKSHSSTITGAEADQIRQAAVEYIAKHSPSKPDPARPATHSQSVESKKKTPLNIQKKQQILEIRRPIIRPHPAAEQPELQSPPQPRSESQPPTPIDPLKAVPAPDTASLLSPTVSSPITAETSLETTGADASVPETQPQPIRPMVDSPVDAPVDAPLTIDNSASADDPVPPEQPPLPTPSAPRQPAEILQPPTLENPPVENRSRKGDAVLEPPGGRSLAQPPTRPVAQPRSTSVHKPVLKRDKPAAGSETPGKAEGASNSRQQRGVKSQQGSGGNRRTQSAPGQETGVKPQQIVELRRPKPLPTPDQVDPDTAPSLEQPVLRVNRPTKPDPQVQPNAPAADLVLNKPIPPKPRRAKGWEEEEEEVQEFPEKAAKLGAKGKRRTQPRIQEDDEDDFDLSDEANSAVSQEQVSLSLARPARPKSLPGQQPRVAAIVSVPAAPRRRGAGGRDRRDRRDQEAKQERPTQITLVGSLTVQELANAIAVQPTEIITKLFMKGIAATITQTLDIETATMVAQEYDIEVTAGERTAEAKKVTEMLDLEDLDSLQRRPPVVTIMGHVDHGKTTLLDSIRKTKVAAGEAGGITQHIGAYHVDVEHNDRMQQVVFLDTPGHEAFTAMRARGARVTDIAILVVAADDGVQPQTIEAISHAKAAEVPIVIAINKVDKEDAQPDRVKQELTEYGLVPEEWGGDTIMVPVSAITGDNLDTLLEMILLVSEVEDLSANPDRPARGTVIEAHLDKAKGPVATLLIQNGTLRVGDILVAGSSLGKVRAMVDDRGKRVQIASPSFAVEVLGLSDVPAAGDEFQVFREEKEARAVSSNRADEQRQSRLLAAMSSRRVSLNTLSAKAQEGELKELNLVMKADVQGSVEAILGSLRQLPQNEVQVRVLFAAPGEISETDVDLAAASDAVIIGFNTTLATGARQAADRAGVDVREYNIIYKLLDDIQGAMEGLLDPELVEEPLGQVEVRAVFPVGRSAVAGCYVQSGKLIRNCKVRVHRGGNIIHEGNLDSLKRMKEDAKEVNSGYECGIGLDNFSGWQLGDTIESYRMVTKRRTLSATR